MNPLLINTSHVTNLSCSPHNLVSIVMKIAYDTSAEGSDGIDKKLYKRGHGSGTGREGGGRRTYIGISMYSYIHSFYINIYTQHLIYTLIYLYLA